MMETAGRAPACAPAGAEERVHALLREDTEFAACFGAFVAALRGGGARLRLGFAEDASSAPPAGPGGPGIPVRLEAAEISAPALRRAAEDLVAAFGARGLGVRMEISGPPEPVLGAPLPAPAPVSTPVSPPVSPPAAAPGAGAPRGILAALAGAEGGAFAWDPRERGRVALFPPLHGDLWALVEKLQGLSWQATEVRLDADAADFQRLSPGERHFVSMQLAFFALVDRLVIDNIGRAFADEVDCTEASLFYATQTGNEAVHALAYALQIQAVVADPAEQARLADAVRSMPIIARMSAWVTDWFAGGGAPLGERLVAFAAVEGVLFCASFCALQWLREKGVLPGVTAFNEFIARDEGVHTAFTCLLVRRYLRARPAAARAAEIFRSLVAVLDDFVGEALPVDLLGMGAAAMRQYVRFQADAVLADLGYPAAWGAANPFAFMDKQSLNAVTKANFFETRPTGYQAVTDARAVVDTSAVDDSDGEA